MSQLPYELVVREGPEKGRRIPLPSARFTIGSNAGCELRFPPNLVRDVHAELYRDDQGDFQLHDKSGANLTWVDGKVIATAQLFSGSVLRLGRLELMFISLDDTAAADPSQLLAQSSPVPLGGEAANELPPARPPSGLQALKATPLGNSVVGDPAPKPTRVADSDPSASGRFIAGDLIQGRYRITARIAAGGMGEVYKVEHVELGKALAMKVMLPSLNADQEFVNRFKIEAVAASRIGHQNIVDISDFGRTTDGRFFFVMEFLDGMTLSSLVHRQGQQSPPRAVALVVQVARALAAAHELNIVHRDLKPDNVMVLQRPGNPDLVKVLDFGVARVKVDDESIGKTAAGIVVGTPQYMSPEQAKAVPVDARSDIYSLGLILHELLGGKPAFTGETPPIVMVKQVTEAPPPLPDWVPDDLQALVFGMLEKAPEDRPQTMRDVVTRLDSIRSAIRTSDFPTDQVGSGTIVQQPTPPPTKSGRRSGAKTGTPVRNPTPARPSGRPGTSRAVIGDETVRNLPKDVVARVEPEAVGTTSEELELAAVQRSSKLPLIIGALVVLVLAGVGVLVFGGGSGDPVKVVKVVPSGPENPPEKTPPPEVKQPEVPPPPSETTTLLETVPPGAEVSESGVVLGNTPFTLKRKPGDVVALSFSLAGFQPASRKVLVSADVPSLKVNLEATRKPPPEGTEVKKPAEGKPPKEPKTPGLKPPPPELDLKPAPF